MAVTVSELQARMSVDQSSRAKFKRDMSDADSTMDKLSRSGSRHFAALGNAAKVGFLAAGAAIGTGLAVAAKVGFDEFSQGQKVAAQTGAVLKSTGGIANVTAKQIDALGTSLMEKSGIDDEVIKTGENMLLTFKNIRNEVGAGNDIFNQATTTLTDMTVALGSDPQKQAIQLGKALNDPIAGLGALARVGVTFSQSQKDAITAMVEAGDTMGAQKTILKELNSEFGGSAEAAGKTFSGQLNILKETFANTAGEIVGRFMPLVVSLAKVVLPLVAKGLEFVADWLGKFADAATKRGGEVNGVFQKIWRWVKENIIPIVIRLKDIAVASFERFKKAIEDNRPALQRIWDRLDALRKFLFAILLPIIRLVFVEILPRVLTAVIVYIDKVSGAIAKVVDWVKRAYTWIKDKLGSPQVAKAIDIIIAPFKTFRDVAQSIVDKIKWLIDHIPDIPHLPKEPSWSKGGLLGDGMVGAGIGAVAGAASISPTLYDDLGLGQSMGLTLTSGYRPGAVTSTGNPSLHGVYPAKAIDMSGSEGAMRAFFLREVARGALTGLREIIHSPYWWHPGVGITAIPASAGTVLADHYNHVHVGSYDQGGYLRPGWNLAYNGLGRNEPVGVGGVTVNVSGSVIAERDLRALINKLDEDHYRRGGR